VTEDDGSYRAEIFEFPGCIAAGATANDALASLDEIATSWIEAELASGHQIPDPIEENDFSGKLVLRLPRSLHKRAAYVAERNGVSLNTYIVTALAGYIGDTQPKAASVLPHSLVLAHRMTSSGMFPAASGMFPAASEMFTVSLGGAIISMAAETSRKEAIGTVNPSFLASRAAEKLDRIGNG
jgi:predicted RNase H-like HicB family nuclease